MFLVSLGAGAAKSTRGARVRIEFHRLTKLDASRLTCWTGDGHRAQVQIEVLLGEQVPVTSLPRLAENFGALCLDLDYRWTRHVATVEVRFGEADPLLVEVILQLGQCLVLGTVGRCDRACKDGLAVQIGS